MILFVESTNCYRKHSSHYGSMKEAGINSDWMSLGTLHPEFTLGSAGQGEVGQRRDIHRAIVSVIRATCAPQVLK